METLAVFYYGNRHKITKALGKRGQSCIDIISVKKGDRFLLTSDGIHDNLTTDEIEEVIKKSSTPAEIAKNLKDKALARSREPIEREMRAKPDDMSVVAVVCR